MIELMNFDIVVADDTKGVQMNLVEEEGPF